MAKSHFAPMARIFALGVATLLTGGLAACSGASSSSLGSGGSDSTDGGSSDGAASLGPTFHKDVEPILQQHCQTCHRKGGIAPFALSTYGDAKPMAAAMKDQTQRGLMPPWGASASSECKPPHPWRDDARLSAEQISLLAAWADRGTPEGDPRDAPAPIAFGNGTLPGANAELLPASPFVASGDRDQFRCFVMDPKLVARRYVNGTFVIPGNPKVVHHAVVFTDPKGASRALVGADGSYECSGGARFDNAGVVAVWAPGALPVQLPSNLGYPVEAGTLLVLQIHYHPAGATAAEPDATKVQLRFTDQRPEYYLFTAGIGNFASPTSNGDGLLAGPNDPASGPEFRIPANVKGHTESMQWTVPNNLPPNIRLYGLMAHMHLVGYDMKIDLVRANGEAACLLQEPHWDFGWQRFYAYDAPIEQLPAVMPGDKVRLRCTYDNTMGNAHLAAELAAQHQEVKEVRLGEQTTDEMCITLPQLVVPAF
jgi:hypothetical protein